MEVSNKENIESRQIADKLTTPFCLIPVGTTNMIANSVYGITNLVSPLMYLFYGTINRRLFIQLTRIIKIKFNSNKKGIKMKVDMMAAFTSKNQLHSFGFSYSCGFGSTLARYVKRYVKMGNTKMHTSLLKGISKKKHRFLNKSLPDCYWLLI